MFSLKMLASPGEVQILDGDCSNTSLISQAVMDHLEGLTQLMEEHPLQYWYKSMVISGLPW